MRPRAAHPPPPIVPRALYLLVGLALTMFITFCSIARRASRGGIPTLAAREKRAATLSRPPAPPAPPPHAPAATYAAALHAPLLHSKRFVVPADYDYTRSTAENYRAQPLPSGEHAPSYGRYRAIRESLDHAYHGRYTRARQVLQDELLDQVVGPHKVRQANPWIVFTAGAMGAGKSHTIRWLSSRGIFPLADIVQVDSDLFKCALPEWAGYVATEPLAAGRQTRTESGYLVEIAQEAALRTGKHVWVDGSLRDCEWYRGVFARIRRLYPDYQIAILYVTANETQVAARVKRRAEATGRHVPDEELRDSLARVPASVAALAPCAHFLAVIDNSGAEPELVKWCESDLCYLEAGRWDEIRSRFRTVLAPPASERGAADELLLLEVPAGPSRGRAGEAVAPAAPADVCVPVCAQ